MQEKHENPLLQHEMSEEDKKNFFIGQYKQDAQRMAQFEDVNNPLYGQEGQKGIVQRKLDAVLEELKKLGVDPDSIDVFR